MSIDASLATYEKNLEAAIWKAIVETPYGASGKLSILLTGEAVSAAMNVVAMMAAGSSGTSSPTKTREFTATFEKRLRTKISKLKESMKVDEAN